MLEFKLPLHLTRKGLPEASYLPAPMIVSRAVIKAERRAVVGRAIIIGRRWWITIDGDARRSGRWRRLVHVEIDLLRYPVLRSHHMAGLEHSHLLELIRHERQCA